MDYLYIEKRYSINEVAESLAGVSNIGALDNPNPKFPSIYYVLLDFYGTLSKFKSHHGSGIIDQSTKALTTPKDILWLHLWAREEFMICTLLRMTFIGLTFSSFVIIVIKTIKIMMYKKMYKKWEEWKKYILPLMSSSLISGASLWGIWHWGTLKDLTFCLYLQEPHSKKFSKDNQTHVR